MSSKIQFKRGNKIDLPSFAPSGMPLWCEDTKELYIGTENGVANVNSPNTPIKNLVPSTTNVSLECDTAYYLNLLTNNLNFILPIPENTNIFHEILVQLKMSTALTINLGTTYFLNDDIPDMSEPGDYDLIYEFHPYYNQWFCGVIKKKV